MSEFDRIRWQCRRGMLELDLVLNRFLEQEYPQLHAQQVQAFKELLGEADTQLLAWVMGQEQAPDRYRALVGRLQQV